MPELAIVIVSFNTREITINCLNSIFDNTWKVDYEVWVVDNGSTDGSPEEIAKRFPKAHLIKSEENLGFVGGNNLALAKVYKTSKHVLLLNSDTKLSKGSLDSLYDYSKTDNYDITSCKLVNPNGSFQPNAGDLPTPVPLFFWLSGLDDIFRKYIRLPSYHRLDTHYYENSGKVGWVSGAAMLIGKEVFDKIGLFDKKIFMYAEDVDFCWRATKEGFKVGWTKDAQIAHIGGASSDSPKAAQWRGEFRGLLYLYKKNYGIFASLVLKLFIYLFGIIRSLAFLIVGKPDYALTYAKITFTV